MFSLAGCDQRVEPAAALAMLVTSFPQGALWKDAYAELFRFGYSFEAAETLIDLAALDGFVERRRDGAGREVFLFHEDRLGLALRRFPVGIAPC